MHGILLCQIEGVPGEWEPRIKSLILFLFRNSSHLDVDMEINIFFFNYEQIYIFHISMAAILDFCTFAGVAVFDYL